MSGSFPVSLPGSGDVDVWWIDLNRIEDDCPSVISPVDPGLDSYRLSTRSYTLVDFGESVRIVQTRAASLRDIAPWV